MAKKTVAKKRNVKVDALGQLHVHIDMWVNEDKS